MKHTWSHDFSSRPWARPLADRPAALVRCPAGPPKLRWSTWATSPDHWINWIGLRENLNRKPWFLPLNMGLSCKFFPLNQSNDLRDFRGFSWEMGKSKWNIIDGEIHQRSRKFMEVSSWENHRTRKSMGFSSGFNWIYWNLWGCRIGLWKKYEWYTVYGFIAFVPWAIKHG